MRGHDPASEGKTPDGKEVRAHIRRLVRRIRMHWPNTIITIRGDSHYGRKEAMDWCDDNGVKYIFGLGPNKTLAEQIFPKLDNVCVRRAIGQLDKVRDFADHPLCREILVPASPGRGADRGDPERGRHPLHRHQPHQGHRAMAL